MSVQWIGRVVSSSAFKFLTMILEIPSTYPNLPTFSKSESWSWRELIKSVIFIAFLHVSFRKNWRLNVLLFEFILLLEILFVWFVFNPVLHMSTILFVSSWFCFTTSSTKSVSILISFSLDGMISFSWTNSLLKTQVFLCFHKPELSL